MNKKIFKDVKRLLIEKLRPSGFVAFAEFQARKLRPGETALLYVHELKRLLEDAMPNLDADSQDRILFQQLLAGLPDDCSRAEIKTTADAVSRVRLLMTVSHQASVPTVASVNAGKDSQTAAIDTLQGHVMHLTEQMSSLVDRQLARRFKRCCSGAALMGGLSSGA